jgi:hypothetical protein
MGGDLFGFNLFEKFMPYDWTKFAGKPTYYLISLLKTLFLSNILMFPCLLNFVCYYFNVWLIYFTIWYSWVHLFSDFYDFSNGSYMGR